jgi:SAM-dependent methyltransferase
VERRYADKYRELFERHWWWRAREDEILWHVRRLRLRGDPPHILDVGCGDGLFFPQLERFGRVEGIESDGAVISPTADRRRIHVRPFDETFDPGRRFALITMLDVLEHFEDRVSTLRRAVELLEPDGTLLITLPAFPSLWTAHDVVNHHYVRYTKRTFRDDARRAGVHIEEMRYFFLWPAAAKLVIRLKERVLGAALEPAEVPPRPINALLYAASLLEHRIGRVVPFGVGSSLIVRARRADAGAGAERAHGA